VTKDHGPFHTVDRADSIRITSNYERSTDGIPNGRIESEAKDIFRFTGPRGSVAFCNTNTNLHRTGVPAEGNWRDVLQFMFAPMSKPLPDDWFDHPEETFVDASKTKRFRRLLHY